MGLEAQATQHACAYLNPNAANSSSCWLTATVGLLPLQCCPPDVWLQLRQLLEQHSTDGAYLRKLMDEQRQAAAQQQEQLQQAQQQLQEAQQQLQQAQDTIAELQAQLAGGGQQQPA